MSGRRVFTVDEVLTAANVNSYLMDQAVPQFASPAARDTQWPAPPNGAMCVTVDTFTVWQRISGSWLAVAPVRKTWAVQEATIGGSVGGTITQIGGPLTVASTPQDRLALVQVQVVTNEANATQVVQINLRRNGGDLAVGKGHPGNTMWLQRFLLLTGGGAATFTVHAQVVLGGGTVGYAADPNWNLLSVSVIN